MCRASSISFWPQPGRQLMAGSGRNQRGQCKFEVPGERGWVAWVSVGKEPVMRFPASVLWPSQHFQSGHGWQGLVFRCQMCIWETHGGRVKGVVNEWIMLLFHGLVPHPALSLAIIILKSRRDSREKTVGAVRKLCWGWLTKLHSEK